MAKFAVVFKDKSNSDVGHRHEEADTLKAAIQKLAGPDVTPWPPTATQVDVRELTV